MAAVRQGMSVRKAGFMFQVPRQTIGDHTMGRRAPVELTEEEEMALVDYITCISAHNMPLCRRDIKTTIVLSFDDIMTLYVNLTAKMKPAVQ